MTPRRLEHVAYACGLAVAGAAVVFLWAIEFGPRRVVAWWQQVPAVTS